MRPHVARQIILDQQLRQRWIKIDAASIAVRMPSAALRRGTLRHITIHAGLQHLEEILFVLVNRQGDDGDIRPAAA